MTTGAALFLDLLRAQGVDFVFGNPGTTELPLVDAFAAETGIRYILGLNEVVVLGMADGYAQATGRLAVANLHAAPGLGNAMGMLYNAAKAGAPILVTAGQQDTTIALTEPLLWADLATLARPLVKWSYEVAPRRRPAAQRPPRGQGRADRPDRAGVPVDPRRRPDRRCEPVSTRWRRRGSGAACVATSTRSNAPPA